MSKILGYSGKGGKDWFSSVVYSDHEIEAIADPEGGSDIQMPTAIPSPFARMDVVRTAFRNINKTSRLKAENISVPGGGDVVRASKLDERLVSHTLDLLELLFHSNDFGDRLEIVVWDRHTMLQSLMQSSPQHQRYAQTLDLYLSQDSKVYNFEKMEALYLVRLDHRIIGCTSPCTLFFPTANSLEFAQTRLTMNDILFDEDYCPLYKRDTDFQRYVHLLFKANPELAEDMKEVAGYLKKNLAIQETADPELYDQLQKLKPEDLSGGYDVVDAGAAGSRVEVLGVSLYKQRKGSAVESDFAIAATKAVTGTAPLVLQNDLNAPLRYVNDRWDKQTKVPYVDEHADPQDRWLPGVKLQYPYLTVSDFLEPYLVRLPYPIQSEKYFDGNCESTGGSKDGFLLPLKPRFFDYFSPSDLTSPGVNSPNLKMEAYGSSIKVTLQIPIQKGNFIVFERIYHPFDEKTINKPSEAENKGVILPQEFGITIFPFIKINDAGIPAHYRVHLVDRDVAGFFKSNEYSLSFYNAQSNLPIIVAGKEARVRNIKLNLLAGSKVYVLEHEFDYIQVRNTWASGVILPRWPVFQRGNHVFSFAIDFGTTNTHIEYQVGVDEIKPFDIALASSQIATLWDPEKANLFEVPSLAIHEATEEELIPPTIGLGSEYRFPHRTVLAERGDLDIKGTTYALADFNIPFTYERKAGRDNIRANLKWAKREPGNVTRVERFLENLVLMIRNKVLLGGGSLRSTRIIWFYPSSMGIGRSSGLKDIWDGLCLKYFGEEVVPIQIPESLAPFYFYKEGERVAGGAFKPAVSIDIGGGTSDVVVFKDNKPLLLTSFRFAANTIFGDGFTSTGAAGSHGIVKKYLKHFEQLLDKADLRDLAGVLAYLKGKNRSEDISAFLFSVAESSKVGDKTMYSFNRMLSRDDSLKLVFLYFYTAIIFHIAELMKFKEIELPSYLLFSGTGSKILSILTSNNEILVDFSKKVFAQVFGKDFDEDGLTIRTTPQPKEITSRGALMTTPTDLSMDVGKIKTVLTTLEGDDIKSLTWNMVEKDVLEKLIDRVKGFNNFFIGLDEEYSFDEHFNISKKAMSVFREEMNKHLRDYLISGVEFNKGQDEIGSSAETVGETLFFYPIVGIINSVSIKLAELNPDVMI